MVFEARHPNLYVITSCNVDRVISVGDMTVPTRPTMKEDAETVATCWDRIFQYSKIHGRKKRQRHMRAVTDGVSCCLFFLAPSRGQIQFSRKPTADKQRKLDQQQSLMDLQHYQMTRATETKHRLVGLDPGRRDLFVAVDSTSTKTAPKITRISTKSVRHLITGRSDWANRLDCTKDFHDKLLKTPSAKTASVSGYLQHLDYILKMAPDIWSVYGADRRYRKHSWQRYMRRQRVMDTLCKKITKGNRNTVVALL